MKECVITREGNEQRLTSVCVCAPVLIPGVGYRLYCSPGRMKGLSPHSGLEGPHTHTHSNEEFPFAASPINQEMN